MATALRLIAINHGFPFIYHSDEPAVIRSALGIRFSPNPEHFDWPHLYFYLNYLLFMGFAAIRKIMELTSLQAAVSGVAPIIWNDNLIFYLLSRVLSALLGALTVIPLYLWIKKLVNRTSAVLASILLAVAPFHVRHSHYALIDVPMLFFLTWSLFFATFSPMLSGLFLGLSASTKYNGILGALFITGYYLLTKRKFIDLVKTGIFSVVGFFLGTPYALLDWETFIRSDSPRGALWQFTNVGNVEFIEQVQKFTAVLFTKFPHDLGYGAAILLAVGLATIIFSVVKKKQLDKIILLTAVVFLALVFYVSGLEKNRAHYYMVVYPYFFLLAGWSLSLPVAKLRNNVHKVALVTLILVPSLVLSIVTIRDLANKQSSSIYGGDTISQNETNQ